MVVLLVVGRISVDVLLSVAILPYVVDAPFVVEVEYVIVLLELNVIWPLDGVELPVVDEGSVVVVLDLLVACSMVDVLMLIEDEI